MKKSKLFTGIAAFTLVIAGVVASKAAKKTTYTGAFYTSNALTPIEIAASGNGASCLGLGTTTISNLTTTTGGTLLKVGTYTIYGEKSSGLFVPLYY